MEPGAAMVEKGEFWPWNWVLRDAMSFAELLLC